MIQELVTKPKTIAVDGPVAAGKNAVGSLLARKLGYRFLDSGAMYRALTWLALERGLDLTDEAALSQLAAETEIDLIPPVSEDDINCRVLVNGRDVSFDIRQGEVERGVSLVSRVSGVRQILTTKQRGLAQGKKVVMAGRDIGTVVLPQAELKLYLEASAKERARRRYLELVGQDQQADYSEVLADLQRRDKIDTERELAPLQPAPDAVVINTDGLDIEQVVAKILDLIQGD